MAPAAIRKRKSDQIEDAAHTPTSTPAQKKLKITQSQKQALIDNLQFEITERARKLRAHYALQCADLRARIERRINRVPMSLRQTNMGELFERHMTTQRTRSRASPPLDSKPTSTQPSTADHDRPLPVLPQALVLETSSREQPATRGKKRKSSEIYIALDKEHDDKKNTAPEMLPVPKNTKRTKAGPTVRATSRTTKANSVLSPRSHNSRTLPRSPIEKAAPPYTTSAKQSFIARPTSPLKPASPLRSAASAATSAISASIHGMVEQAKRGNAAAVNKLSRPASREKPSTMGNTPVTAANIPGKMLPPPRPATALRTTSQSSNHSTTSNGSASSTSTTVVKKGGKTTSAAIKDTKTSKTGVVSAAKTALKKNAMAMNKKVVVAEPATDRRVLRSRN